MSSEETPKKKASEGDSAKKETPSERIFLPFEPKRKKATQAVRKATAPTAFPRSKAVSSPSSSVTSDIPEVVNRRMLKRMATFCGVPTFLGISTFFVSYFVTTRELFTLPHTAVLLVSLGFFGLGVIGLSYGALSASWDEADPGSVLGVSEFQTNLGRLRGAWQEAGDRKRQSKDK